MRAADPRIARVPAAAAVSLLIWMLSGVGVTAATPGRLVFVGTDYNIYECDGDCGKPQCLTCPVPGMEARATTIEPVALRRSAAPAPATDFGWPTYSPDGRKVAYVSAGGRPGRQTFGVYVYDLDKRLSLKLFESSTERGIYLFWLPGGKRLSFLVTEPDGRLSLMLAEVREGAPIRIVVTGAPLYYDWSRATDELLVHTNATGSGSREQVSLISLTSSSQDVERVLARGYTPFKTPSWSPDGKHLAFVASEKEVAHLYLADPDGKNPKALVKLLPGQSSFVWAPDSRHLAFSTAQLPPNNVFDGISLLDVTDGSVKKLVGDEVAAYYFSPDSKHIAYVGVPPKRPFYTVNVVGMQSEKPRRLASFLTTTEETIAWRYFEQLSLSHSVWAPDSSAITFAGVLLKKEPRKSVPPATMQTPAPKVTIIPIGGGEPRQVAEGIVAFWSPAPGR